LLLMRLGASAGLVLQVCAWTSGASAASTGLCLAAAGAAVFLLLGLWTPLAGVVAAMVACWHGVSMPAESLADMLLGVMALSLALLGPGAWSVDARLFGWERVEIDHSAIVESSPQDSEPFRTSRRTSRRGASHSDRGE
jgi:hypothetical protein